MRKLATGILLTGAAALTACATYAPRPMVAANAVCGAYGYVDVNNDGFITGTEWNTFRTSTYGSWDVNRDGRVSRSEFENCYRAGGFYREAYYQPNYWTNYWTSFDANGDGYLDANEYWSTNAWTRVDRNGNGRIDSDEWVWWGS